MRHRRKIATTTVWLEHCKLTAEMIPNSVIRFKPAPVSERLCINTGVKDILIADCTGETANLIPAKIEADNGVIRIANKALRPDTCPARRQITSINTAEHRISRGFFVRCETAR